jgi:hypothetical protein
MNDRIYKGKTETMTCIGYGRTKILELAFCQLIKHEGGLLLLDPHGGNYEKIQNWIKHPKRRGRSGK